MSRRDEGLSGGRRGGERRERGDLENGGEAEKKAKGRSGRK